MIEYSKDFKHKYCNWGNNNCYIITIDIDFVPDFMVLDTINLLQEYGCKATFFITHDSKAIDLLKNEKLFEIGIHPNLDNNSTQIGSDSKEKISYLKNLYSGIVSNKFHILGYSYKDFYLLKDCGIKLDCSMCYYETPYLLPAYHSDVDLVIVPYWWEDGFTLSMKKNLELDKIAIKTPGIKIFTFHPLDIYLNTYSFEMRNKIKSFKRSVINITKEELLGKRNMRKTGIRDYFIELLNLSKLPDVKFITCRDLNYAFRSII